MPLQKRRMGPSRIHHRRSAWMRQSVKPTAVGLCQSCGEPRLPHRVCLKCGQYNGKTVIEVERSDEE